MLGAMTNVLRVPTVVLSLALAASCGPIRSTSTPLDVGVTAPAFTLPDQAGREVSLASLTATGPAVLVFNRGHR